MVDDDSQLNVLIIEDDADLRDVIAQALARAGHQVVLAESAEEGLALLPEWTFQAAIVDHQLPGMQGVVLGEYLRRNNPDMGIVLTTGLDDARVERRSKDLSLRFLPKPFLLTDLLSILDEFVVSARRRDDARRLAESQAFHLPWQQFVGELEGSYGIPRVPNRIEERLVSTVKRCLGNLKSSARYTERERVIAFAGIVAAQVLGVPLPRTKSGRTLLEEYDEVMMQRGRRPEFGRSSRGEP